MARIWNRGTGRLWLRELIRARFIFTCWMRPRAVSRIAPDLIVPDTNAGTKRWVLASSPSRFWNNSTDPTVNSDESIGVKPGDIWKNGANLWVCNSAVAGTASWIRLLKLGTGGTDACAGNDARLSDARPALPHDHVEAEISDLKSYSFSTHDHDATYSAIGHNHNRVTPPCCIITIWLMPL